MSYPSWMNLDVIKSAMYLDLKDTDTTRDNALVLLGQMVTGEMICYLDNPSIDTSNPPIALVRACLKQCTFEWRQRKTPGLSSVQMSDGSINKYQIDEWLQDVEKVLRRHMRYALYETSTTQQTYADPEPSYAAAGATGSAPPSAPILSSVTAGDGSAVAAWANVSDAVSYNLYYMAGATVNKTIGTKIASVTSPKTISSLTNGVQYAVAVSAVNATGESALSNIITATPAAPVAVVPDFSWGTKGNRSPAVGGVDKLFDDTTGGSPSAWSWRYKNQSTGLYVEQYTVQNPTGVTVDNAYIRVAGEWYVDVRLVVTVGGVPYTKDRAIQLTISE